MNEQLPYMVEPYAALSEVYARAGFADFAIGILPQCVSFAQTINWAGHRILDLGCGTGQTTWWLAQQGYRVIGIDNNPYMLDQAERYVQGEVEQQRALGAQAQGENVVNDPPDFLEMDIRQFETPLGLVDMALAAGGVLNAIQSLRELEAVFAHVNMTLNAEKLFIFDMRTIRGLAEELGDRDSVVHDNGFNLMVLVQNRFSYETLSNTRRYSIFRQQGLSWQRQDETHIERGYPTQGVAAMLERTGFHVAAVLSPEMTPFDIRYDVYGRVIFVAQKRA
jgi:SAM-dependent methyltransferase